MKNNIVLFLFIVLVIASISSSAIADETEDQIKAVSANLCEILKKGDKTSFEAMLAADRKNQMQWWWEASGKGKYFPELFGSCAFDHIDPKTGDATDKKVFIQRFNKDGTKWGRPAPVRFKKDSSGEWKITSYSL